MTGLRVAGAKALIGLLFVTSGVFAGPATAAAAATAQPAFAAPLEVVRAFWEAVSDGNLSTTGALGLPGHHLDRTVELWNRFGRLPWNLWMTGEGYEVEINGDQAMIRCGDSHWRWQFWLVKRDGGWLIQGLAQLPTSIADQIEAHIGVDLANRKIYGRTSMRLTSKTTGLGAVALGLSRGLTLQSLSVDGVEVEHPWSQPGGFLVEFNAPLDRDEHAQVTFEYEGTPEDVWPNGRVSSGIQPNAVHLFVPLGESGPWTTPEVGDYYVTVPHGFVAVADGQLVDRTAAADGRETFHFKGHPYELMVGPFKPVEQVIDGITVRWNLSYYLDGRGDEALDLTQRALDFLAEKFGPYPGDRLTITEAPPEMGGGVFADKGVIALVPYRTKVSGAWREWPNLVSHEITHEWWGYQVSGEWPLEAMATYAADAFVASERGDDEWLGLTRFHRSRYLKATRSGDVPILGASSAAPPYEMVYDKGALVLHMLRYQIGDDAFWRTLRMILDRYGAEPGQPIPYTVWDFMATAEEVSGQDLDWFAQQWLEGTDRLDLSLDSWYTDRVGEGYATVATIVDHGTATTPFVDLLIDTGRSKEVKRVDLTGETTYVTLATSARPRRLVLDPKGWLLDVDLSNNVIGRMPLDRGSPLRPAIIILGVAAGCGLAFVGLWWFVLRVLAPQVAGRRPSERQAVLGTLAVVFPGLLTAYLVFMPNPLYIIAVVALSALSATGAAGVAARWERKALFSLASQAGFAVIKRPSDEATQPLVRELRLYCDPAVFRSEFSGQYPYLIGRHGAYVITVRRPLRDGPVPEGPDALRVAAYLKSWVRGMEVRTARAGRGNARPPAATGDAEFDRAFQVEAFDRAEVPAILSPEARRLLLASLRLGVARVRVTGQGLAIYLKGQLRGAEDVGQLAQILAALAAGVREAERKP